MRQARISLGPLLIEATWFAANDWIVDCPASVSGQVQIRQQIEKVIRDGTKHLRQPGIFCWL